ncbi:hypothetical protein SAMN04515665_1028 [Blastococcus sp. DSM 46786]|uniref:hypothetical protein n=1 Tax=Blastococcus sp. DSM 46786 TaxID=1798227 RepID=UPI0008B76310|nr:hypothetical protein [Blastococcus sp. DSM 46786]SEK37958.1 hypothetical protein SAMN04515665_1028 [Blastococcus sp. DSM 46786]
MTRRGRRSRGLWLLALVVALATGGTVPAGADTTTQPQTFQGPGYSPEYADPPTGSENQSKLWFHADAWWALIVEPTGRSARVFELMPDHTWRPTSAVVNTDTGDVGDALRDGDAVHVVTRSSDASLFYVNLSFDAAARDYRVAAPVLVTPRNSGSPPTIAKDAAGALWVGYATATNVVVIRSLDGGLTWGRVTTLSSGGPGGAVEAGALIAFDDRVGMLWSDQASGSFRFASHRAGDDPTVWTQEVAVSGPNVADNHVSLGRIPGASGDTLVAVVKTADGDPIGNPAAGKIAVLVRAPGGQWSTVLVSSLDEGFNDPIVQVDLATNSLHVLASYNGSIVRKTSPLDAIAFPPGMGTTLVNGTGHQLSNPTGTKDVLDARSGLVVLASDWHSRTYRHAEMPLGPPAADPADQVPPTSPPTVQAQVLSSGAVALSWAAASDGDRWVPGGTGVPVAGYVVSRDGVEIASVPTTGMRDQLPAASETAASRVVEYSVAAVDASGNRSAPAALTVEIPAGGSSRTLVLVAVGLLALAAVLAAGYLLYRWRVVRGTQLPRPPQRSRELTRERTPVA